MKEKISAMMAGREMDRLVADKLMSLNLVNLNGHVMNFTGRLYYEIPNYSTDISAAWEVVERYKEKFNICTYMKDEEGFEDGWIVKFGESGVMGIEAAPEAICKAALLAVMEL
jgi:hypothetical protein